MSEHNASICEYCRRSGAHQVSCPEGDTIAIQIWRAGYEAALNGQRNTRASDETYSLGFTSGESERERLNASERRPSTPPEELFPEEAPTDRPSRAPVSVTEFSLLVGEILEPSPITPTSEDENADDEMVPPVLQARLAYAREVTAREADLY